MEINPYTILGLNSASSKAEITKAMAIAMKEKRYPVQEIAKAQKSLMKPEERLVADFLMPHHDPISRFQKSDFSQLQKIDPHFEMLPEGDLVEEFIVNRKKISEEDIRLGQAIADSFDIGEPDGLKQC